MTNSTTKVNTCEQPASACRKPVNRFLVVCGAYDISDAWFFGNFVGFCHALQLLGVNGEFWSCFPIKQYFEKWESVKFGEKCSGNSAEDRKELAIFTKADFNDQKEFWKNWDSTRRHELPVAVSAFIVKLSKKLEAGDIFNLILMSHGDTEGLRLGGQTLKYSALVDSLGKLKPGVRVNVFVQSCHSGAFVEIIKAKSQRAGLVHTSSQHDQSSYPARLSVSGRHRNSKFGGAFLESLGLAVDPNASSWTIEGHLKWVQRFGKGSDSNPKAASNPDHELRDIALVTKFVDVLFTDYEDRQFVQAANMARRVLTPQHSTMPPSPPQINIASELLQNAVESVAREVDFRGEYDERDAGLASSGTGSKWLFENKKMTAAQYQNDVLEQMRGLRWRFRVQESFYVAMAKLSDRGLIDFALAFDVPVDWDPSSKTVSELIDMLKSFSLVRECTRLGGGTDFQRLFDSPVYWLAIIIARTCTDINRTFRYLATSKWLGDFDRAHFRSVMPKFMIQSAEQGLSATTRTIEPPQIGFWLPCDTSSRGLLAAIIGESMTRYRSFRTAYEGCYGHGSWGVNFFFDKYIEVFDGMTLGC